MRIQVLVSSLRFSSRSARLSLALLLVLSVVAACARKPPQSPIDPATYQKEIAQWQEQRFTELKSETGWLTLVGLFWLKEGGNQCGSDPSLDIVLPMEKVPLHLGVFELDHGNLYFSPLTDKFQVDGRPVRDLLKAPSTINVERTLKLNSDAEEKPTILTFGSLSFQIIKRGDKFGLRIKDSQNPDRLNFKGTEFYSADLKWRIDAQFEPYNPAKPMPITNVLGMESSESSPGAVKFAVDGNEYRIDAITEKGERHLFMIVSDKTSGKDTYAAGRYLYVDPPDASGHIVIDFNKAFSPPCAFTKFATCPLPPKQNRLPFAIAAGEKYQKH
jgi:uncharacterized protein (DUF1684 family)